MTKYIRYSPFEEIINNVRLDILTHAYYYGDRNWSAENVSSPFNRLYFMTAGAASIRNRHEAVRLTKNTIYLIPCNTCYDYVCDSSMEKFYIHFRMELQHGRDLFDGIDHCMHVHDASGALTRRILRLLKRDHLGDIIQLKAIMLDLLSHFITVPVSEIRKNISISQKYSVFFSHIDAMRFADIPYQDIAAALGMSLPALSRNFKRDTGDTLTGYATKKMVLKAKEKLALSSLKVKDVAHLLGFKDSFYFSRLFKRHAGISARTYRKKMLLNHT